MNVLMFGWEFPPNISGGLGTACYGIVSGLAMCSDVKVTFVVPKTYGNEQSKNDILEDFRQRLKAEKIRKAGRKEKDISLISE